MKRNKRGFTLVEIIVVLVILAILAAIAIPTTLGYVDDAKEARELAKLRESLIAAQVTFVKSAAFGESGSKEQTNHPTESANRFLTTNQSKDLIKGLNLEVNPYILMYGVGDPDVYGETSQQASKVYCIIYQKTEKSKPWYYDGKKWTHRYLWRKDREGNPEKDSTRAMYVDNLNYTDRYHNRMKDVKDKNGYDTAVCLYYAYVTGNTVTSNPNGSFWRTLKDASE